MKTIDRIFLMVILLAALYIAGATCRYHYFVVKPDGWPATLHRADRFTGAVSIFSWGHRWIRQTPYKKQPVKPAVNPDDPLGLLE